MAAANYGAGQVLGITHQFRGQAINRFDVPAVARPFGGHYQGY
jgi:hypothetical protein